MKKQIKKIIGISLIGLMIVALAYISGLLPFALVSPWQNDLNGNNFALVPTDSNGNLVGSTFYSGDTNLGNGQKQYTVVSMDLRDANVQGYPLSSGSTTITVGNWGSKTASIDMSMTVVSGGTPLPYRKTYNGITYVVLSGSSTDICGNGYNIPGYRCYANFIVPLNIPASDIGATSVQVTQAVASAGYTDVKAYTVPIVLNGNPSPVVTTPSPTYTPAPTVTYTPNPTTTIPKPPGTGTPPTSSWMDIITKFLDWIKAQFFTISGPSTLNVGAGTQVFAVSTTSSVSPNTNYNGGTFTELWGSWSILDSNQNIVSQKTTGNCNAKGSCYTQMASNTYTDTATANFATAGTYSVVSTINQKTWTYASGSWGTPVETIGVGKDQMKVIVSIPAPTGTGTPPTSGWMDILVNFKNWLLSLFS